MYQAILFLPLAGAIFAGFFGRLVGARSSEVITTTIVLITALLSWLAFYQVAIQGQEERIELMRFITSGDLKSVWSLRIDTLTAVMLVVVTTVSGLVHLYSIGYMEEDTGRPRFFAFLSLFTFAMLALVTADDFVQLFFGWEGVGLMSLSAHRLLVSQARCQCRRHQGLHRQPRRRFRLRARHLRRLHFVQLGAIRHGVRLGPRPCRRDHAVPRAGGSTR